MPMTGVFRAAPTPARVICRKRLPARLYAFTGRGGLPFSCALSAATAKLIKPLEPRQPIRVRRWGRSLRSGDFDLVTWGDVIVARNGERLASDLSRRVRPCSLESTVRFYRIVLVVSTPACYSFV
jgi:hypothetical protein